MSRARIAIVIGQCTRALFPSTSPFRGASWKHRSVRVEVARSPSAGLSGLPKPRNPDTRQLGPGFLLSGHRTRQAWFINNSMSCRRCGDHAGALFRECSRPTPSGMRGRFSFAPFRQCLQRRSTKGFWTPAEMCRWAASRAAASVQRTRAAQAARREC